MASLDSQRQSGICAHDIISHYSVVWSRDGPVEMQ